MNKTQQINLWVGTRKGAFLFQSNLQRRKWTLRGPWFTGREVNHVTQDTRTGRVWAAVNSVWFGSEIQSSDNNGRTWNKSGSLKFDSQPKLKINRIWAIVPDRDSRPDTLWCGVDPGGLFRTDNSGKSWHEVTSLTKHPTRKKWNPGAGGMCAHTILPDPSNIRRIHVAISAAGGFRSDDDGKTWSPKNKGVRTDFQPVKFPEVGQCVHRMAMSAKDPDKLYQQNHCGIYRSDDAGDTWQDISRGAPSRFGFPAVMHPHEMDTLYVVPQTESESRFFPGESLAVWRTNNGGKSWKTVSQGLPSKNVYSTVLRQAACADECDEHGLYLGTTNGELYYSRNSGARWELLQSRLPSIYSVQASIY